ncbi:MAG: hypothetical protein V3W18_10315 [candidate division Zixibacteria bacterium]
MKGIKLICVLSILSTFVVARADWSSGDGHKMHFPQNPNMAGWDVKASIPIILAEDWQCSETGWIKDIHWWGSWRNGEEGEIYGFILSIHEDIPADPENPACFSKPGEALWEHLVVDFIVAEPSDPPESQGWYDPSTYEIIYDHNTAYKQYNVFLPESEWFLQEEGTVYWLNIMALVADPENTAWGWKSTLDHWNDDAVFSSGPGLSWFHMYEPAGWPPYVPGDVDGDCDVDLDDLNFLTDYLQYGDPTPPLVVEYVGPFYPAADVDGDCQVNVHDMIYLGYYLDSNGPTPIYCFEFSPEGSGNSLDLSFVVNSGQAEDVPTINEWGMLIMTLILLAVGTFAVLRKRSHLIKLSVR